MRSLHPLSILILLITFLPTGLTAQVPDRPNIPPRECDCPALRVTDHWCLASVIFLGKVTAADTIHAKADVGKWERDNIDRITVGFIVEHTFKGEPSAMVNVKTALDDRYCGFAFRVGSTFLVFAHEADDELITDRCSGTREADVISREFSDSLDYLLEGGTYEIAGETEPDCDEEPVGKTPEHEH